MPVYLTMADVEFKIEDLMTGELPDNFELERDSPRDFYGMFTELLCEHGIRRGLCYPCTPINRGLPMGKYSNIEKMTTTELLDWLTDQKLNGLNRILAKRLADHYSAYYRIRNEANMMRLRLQEKYNDVMVAED